MFSLPGTDSQRALDLLKREFKAQSGDADTIVFHVSTGTIDSPAVRKAITPLLPRVSRVPACGRSRQPLQPERSGPGLARSYDRVRDRQLRQGCESLPTATGTPLLNQVNAVRAPGLQVAAGGQVVDNAEGFSIGPATEWGDRGAGDPAAHVRLAGPRPGCRW